MAIGDLVTNDYEIEFRGSLFGGDTAFSLVSIEGLSDLPEVRTSDRVLLRRNGLHPGDDFVGGREIILTFEVYGSTEAALTSNLETLTAAFRPAISEEPLVFKLPGIAGGNKALTYARTRARTSIVDLQWLYKLPRVAVRLASTDPRLYTSTESVSVANLASAGGGLTFNAAAPLIFGAVSTGGTISATNSGNFDSPFIARFDGPCQSPTIENVTTGKLLKFNITLATGEYLVVDSDARTVLLGGTANRYSTIDISSTWFMLEPGANEIRFSAATSTAATLTLSWRSAWV